ncbi:IclR family transcriptional regulator [Vibrio agarivorans]|uniref:IclR family transcriptional regulator n=1 Tax=Vibrio agarivorans TaxID=153622 RepID=UPI0025B4D51F|nr:IclR family transcriptional regulator [Vibrio agarivorans]MDN3659826.1 IclR family transcriptional regulator [Vibrio agarivorans]
MKAESTKYAVPALDKGLDILEYLATQDTPRSQAEIAVALQRSANEIYRVLVGLEHRGYLVRDDVSGKYRVSLRLYHLSRRIDPVDKVRQCALPHMEDLAFLTGYSCYLSMLYKSQTMVVIHAASHSPVSVRMAEGTLIPTLSSCPGRVLLANSNDDVREMILERDDSFQRFSPDERYSTLEELNTIRETSVLDGSSPFIEGIREKSALIGKPDGSVIAALTMSVLNSPQFDSMNEQDLISQLQLTAEKITLQLGL